MDSGLRRNDPAGNPLIVTRRACNPADTLPQPPIPQMLTHLLGNHTYPSWHYYFIDPRADAGPRVKAPKCEGGWAKSSPPPRFFACRISQTSRLGLRAPQNTSAIQASMARRHDWTGPVLLPSALLDTLNVPIYEL